MNGSRDQQIRQRIAQEAARIMAEEAVGDFFVAKRKAVQRLGLSEQSSLPKNSEVQTALEDYQRLFLAKSQPRQLQQLRKTALEAMEFLTDFKPKLVGSVLSGTAGENSDIHLHIFAACPEDVDHFLIDHHIPFQRGQKKIRVNKDDSVQLPSIRFLAGETEMEIVVFPIDTMHQAPKSPIDGKAMERVNFTGLKSLIDASELGDGA